MSLRFHLEDHLSISDLNSVQKYLHIFQVCSIILSPNYEKQISHTQRSLYQTWNFVSWLLITSIVKVWAEGGREERGEGYRGRDWTLLWTFETSKPILNDTHNKATPPDPSKQFINWGLIMQKYDALGAMLIQTTTTYMEEMLRVSLGNKQMRYNAKVTCYDQSHFQEDLAKGARQLQGHRQKELLLGQLQCLLHGPEDLAILGQGRNEEKTST